MSSISLVLTLVSLKLPRANEEIKVRSVKSHLASATISGNYHPHQKNYRTEKWFAGIIQDHVTRCMAGTLLSDLS